ncbi:hypothetical protein PoB_005702600 [Plakobranchus ocellatus]|uniref:Uncharacterized protein n=1 Tax=Plakobranchus ocellatus TaxID=259542 RepID=A0AAV4C5D4_9GAST|nr:hypothetical protein PoB_005702600 [Plakobranchus ocellatus]
MITHKKRRFEEGLELPTHGSLSLDLGCPGDASTDMTATSCHVNSSSAPYKNNDCSSGGMFHNSVVTCGSAGSDGVDSGGCGGGSRSPHETEGRGLQDSPRSESSLSGTPSSVLGKFLVFVFSIGCFQRNRQDMRQESKSGNSKR